MYRIVKRLTGNTSNILLLGLIIRFLIAPFTLNWDLLKNIQVTARMFEGGLNEVYSSNLAPYPPLLFWTRYLFLMIFKPLIPGITKWADMSDLAILTHPQIFRSIFFIKLPVIILELATAWIFSRMVTQENRRRFLLSWMIGFIPIYTITIFSNIDVFPVFFIALSCLSLYHQRKSLSAFLLGIAASYKLFPVFFLPFFFFHAKGVKEKISSVILFFLPFILTQLPVLGYPNYRQNVMGGDSRLIFTSVISIGYERNLLIFPLAYFLILLLGLHRNDNPKSVPLFSFLSLIPVFVFSSFHVQWVYWLYPFLLLYLVGSFQSHIPFIFLNIGYLGLILLSQASLHIAQLAPIDVSLWLLDKPHLAFLGKDVNLYRDLSHAFFSASLIWLGILVYKNFKRKDL